MLPYLIAAALNPHLPLLESFQGSLLAGIVAIGLGYYFLKTLSVYPAIQTAYYIFPAVTSTFVAVAVSLFMLRAGYSRPLLLASYVLSIVLYYAAYFRSRTEASLSIGVVPVGDIETLWNIRGVRWERLAGPNFQPARYSAIAADFHADMPDAWEAALTDAALAGTTVLHVRQLRETLTGQIEIRRLSENANGSLRPQAAYFTPKLLFDVVMAAFLLVVLAPLLAAVAIITKFSSPGPVLFAQVRTGYRGSSFRVWKFRTMVHVRAAAETSARDAAITLDNDDRITRFGRFLRRSRLDELPQMFNVLLGQMSFIGPRPEARVLTHWYEQEIPFYRYRHIVRPGITGWAQVNQGHVADVAAVHSKLHYDFYYIANFSLWLDVLIVMRTIRTIVTGFGSK